MMGRFEGCQMPCLPKMSLGRIPPDPQPFVRRVKRTLAVPWNYYVKRWFKEAYRQIFDRKVHRKKSPVLVSEPLKVGDHVRIRSWQDIEATLDPFKELKGCAFLSEMKQFCDTNQTVLQVMERFLDERDYKVKKVRGIVLLEGILCRGTPVFGRCDRCCHLFWREEWVERV